MKTRVSCAAAPPATMKRLGGRCILLVDSDAAGLACWRTRLHELGARAIGSSGVDSALANAIAFPAGTFDAAVIEHRPGALDALELAETIRCLPGLRRLPVVAIAADAGDAAEDSPPPLTMTLVRPVDVDRLAERLDHVFSPVMPPSGRDAAGKPVGFHGTVLVAEDDPVNAEMLRAMLCALGLAVETASDGEAAVARSAAAAFDLILMDGQMPRMDGLAAARAIRRRHDGCGSKLPIIGVTANAEADYHAECLAAGMDEVVRKPVAMTTLLRVLARRLPASAGAAKPAPTEPPALPVLAATRDAGAVELRCEVIDWSQVDALRSVDPQGTLRLLDKAIGLYIAHAPSLIESIRGFRTAADLAAVQRAAHSLKSSSACLGATIVSGLSKSIELAAAGGDRERIAATVVQLETEYRRAAVALRTAYA